MLDFVERIEITPNIAGLSFASFEKGKICTKQFNAETDTLFQAASLSKFVFSFLCVLLAEKRVCDLHETVAQILPEFGLPDHLSLIDLLSHKAGLNVHGFPGYPVDAELLLLEQIIQGEAPANTEAMVYSAEQEGKFSYSGMGYCVAQLYFERRTGKKLMELAREYLFAPLHMERSSFKLHPLHPFATAHDENGQIIKGDYHLYPESAAAGLWTTATEMLMPVLNLFDALHGKSALLGKNSAEFLLSSQVSVDDSQDYCLGLLHQKNTGNYSHDGGNAGFNSRICFNIKTEKAFCVLINCETGYNFIQNNFPAYL